MIVVLSDRTLAEVDDSAKVGDLMWSTNGVEVTIAELMNGEAA